MNLVQCKYPNCSEINLNLSIISRGTSWSGHGSTAIPSSAKVWPYFNRWLCPFRICKYHQIIFISERIVKINGSSISIWLTRLHYFRIWVPLNSNNFIIEHIGTYSLLRWLATFGNNVKLFLKLQFSEVKFNALFQIWKEKIGVQNPFWDNQHSMVALRTSFWQKKLHHTKWQEKKVIVDNITDFTAKLLFIW